MGLIKSKPSNQNAVPKASSAAELLDDIISSNLISSRLKDKQGRYFQVDILEDNFPRSKILVEKKLGENTKNTWELDISQFYIFYGKIKDYLDDIKENEIPTETETPKGDDSDDDCVICLERPSEVMLPCTHKFCTQCLENWTSVEKCCPVCRDHADAQNKDSLWHLLDSPSKEELHEDIIKLLDRFVM